MQGGEGHQSRARCPIQAIGLRRGWPSEIPAQNEPRRSGVRGESGREGGAARCGDWQNARVAQIVAASLKMGRYMPITMAPTMPPMKIMIIGSSRLLSASTELFTSCS